MLAEARIDKCCRTRDGRCHAEEGWGGGGGGGDAHAGRPRLSRQLYRSADWHAYIAPPACCDHLQSNPHQSCLAVRSLCDTCNQSITLNHQKEAWSYCRHLTHNKYVSETVKAKGRAAVRSLPKQQQQQQSKLMCKAEEAGMSFKQSSGPQLCSWVLSCPCQLTCIDLSSAGLWPVKGAKPCPDQLPDWSKGWLEAYQPDPKNPTPLLHCRPTTPQQLGI